jgi:hypothetical protein
MIDFLADLDLFDREARTCRLQHTQRRIHDFGADAVPAGDGDRRQGLGCGHDLFQAQGRLDMLVHRFGSLLTEALLPNHHHCEK